MGKTCSLQHLQRQPCSFWPLGPHGKSPSGPNPLDTPASLLQVGSNSHCQSLGFLCPPELNKTCGDRVWTKRKDAFNPYAGRRENTVGSCLTEPVSPPLGIEGLMQLAFSFRGWRYTTKGVRVLNALFLHCLETVNRQGCFLDLAVGPGGWVLCPWGIS